MNHKIPEEYYEERDLTDAFQDMVDTPKGKSFIKIVIINLMVVALLAILTIILL